MNLQSTRIYLLLIIGFLHSCSNKKQEQELKESAIRLRQQNAIAMAASRSSDDYLNKMIFDDYMAERYEYLKPSIKYFIENSDQFSLLVSNAIAPTRINDSDALFNQYQHLQRGYKILKQKITDSFLHVNLNLNINGFMNLDEKEFTEKYLSAKDSASAKLKLLFLQADALLNKESFVDVINSILDPSEGYHFDIISAIGTTEKLVYKRGEKLKLTAVLTKKYQTRKEYAIIDNKRVEATDGLIQYSKKITEKPGLRKIHFKIFIKKNGKMEVYPVEVRYKVE